MKFLVSCEYMRGVPWENIAPQVEIEETLNSSDRFNKYDKWIKKYYHLFIIKKLSQKDNSLTVEEFKYSKRAKKVVISPWVDNFEIFTIPNNVIECRKYYINSIIYGVEKLIELGIDKTVVKELQNEIRIVLLDK